MDRRPHGNCDSGPECCEKVRPIAAPLDQEIQEWISRQHGFVPESARLLHCKELFDLAAA